MREELLALRLDQETRALFSSSFELLRERARTRKGAVLVVWDLLHVDGENLRAQPLASRRQALAKLVRGTTLTISEPLVGHPDAVLAAMQSHGVPGVFARREDAPYPSPDDQTWIAVACGEAPVAWSRSLSPAPVVTNEKKVLFPRDGFTKSDIAAYYADIADVMLPFLRDRPVVAQRWPDGIDELTWYQHRIPPKAPDYLRGVWIEGNHRIVLPTKDALLWMVNQGAITIHGWSSRTTALSEADWVTIDLDPGESTTWADVIEVAIATRKLLELLELPSIPKTSGQRGLHVLIPMAAGHAPARAHELARGIAMMLERLLPTKVTLESAKEKRRGRLFVDHLQNFAGKTLVLLARPEGLQSPHAPRARRQIWRSRHAAIRQRRVNRTGNREARRVEKWARARDCRRPRERATPRRPSSKRPRVSGFFLYYPSRTQVSGVLRAFVAVARELYRTALVASDGSRTTFHELGEIASRLAGGLDALGVSTGDRRGPATRAARRRLIQGSVIVPRKYRKRKSENTWTRSVRRFSA